MNPQPPPSTDIACLNLQWASALMQGLVEGGVRQLVLSPGSRSTPLVLAAEGQPGLATTAVVDERSAAFLALGLARASARPVALVCTSGSAPAHWHPAVVEAHEWGVPLVLLSADRPPWAIGWGANQTTRQAGLFDPHLRFFHDPGLPTPGGLPMMQALGRRAAASSRWPTAGPVHINLPFDEPLVPDSPCPAAPLPKSAPIPAPAPRPPGSEALDAARELLQSGPGLILCGPADPGRLDPAPLLALARRLAAPVLADPLSGLRFGTPEALPLVTRHDALLRNPGLAAQLRPAWVLRFGRPPVSRMLQEWLAGIPTLLVDPEHRWLDPGHDGRLVVAADPQPLCAALTEALTQQAHPAWMRQWQQAERRAATLARQALDQTAPLEGALIHTLLRSLPPAAALLIGNSLPIRQVDTWSGRLAQPIHVFGSRGVSGIDGQVSTLAGIAGGHPAAFGLIGDLALLHDLNGLALLRDRPATLLVINNGGGRIFDYLPQRQLPTLDRHWHTPSPLDIGQAAAAFGIAHHRVEAPEPLAGLLKAVRGKPGPRLIELRVDPEASRRQTLAYWQAVAEDRELAEESPT